MRSKFFLTVCLSFFLLPMALIAQEATISGKITDEAGDPLPGANVLVRTTKLGAATNENGEYSFTVPASMANGQEVTLEARFIGYHTKTEKLNLTPGSHTLDFALSLDVLEMDAIIVTGVVDDTPKAKLAFSVGRVSQQALEQVPSASPESALRGKVAGVRVVRGSGEPGSDASVMLRAPTSINSSGRSQDPLYIIDGVIIDPSVSASPLTDIPAEDIISMEIVKGAAGASLYGSRAANGVVNITTNRGQGAALNQTKIRVRNEFGINELYKNYPLSETHWFRIHEGASDYTDANNITVSPGDFIDNDGNFVDPRATTGRVIDRYTGNYDPNNPDDGVKATIAFSDKPYKWVATGDILLNEDGTVQIDPATGKPVGLQLIPEGGFNMVDELFDPGTFMTNNATVVRNMESTNFSLSFGNRSEDGVIDGLKGFSRRNVRLALDHKFRDDLTVSISGFVSDTDRDDIRTGVGSPFFGLTFISPDADPRIRHAAVGTKTAEFPNGLPEDIGGDLFILPDPLAQRDNPLYEPQNLPRKDETTRIMGGLSLAYQPANWFKLEGSFSYDKSNRERSRFWRIGFQDPFDIDITSGRLVKFPALDQAMNGHFTASFQKALMNNNLTLRTKVRGLFERSELQNTFAQGTDLAVRGVRDLSVANSTKLVIDSEIQQVRSEGFFVTTAFDYKDKYIGDFLIRRDGSSLFGPDERWATYYRVSGAYRIGQESWWPISGVQDFKLRASYGTAGGRPNFFARFETWAVNAGNVSKATLGNKELKPEFAQEFEAGIDFTFANRFSVELTRAESTVEDQLLEVPLPSYAGYTTQWQNAGTLESSTWEASLQGSLLQSRDKSWTFGVVFDRTEQTITELNLPAYNWAPAFTQGASVFRVQEGEEFGALYGGRKIYELNDLLDQNVTQDELSQFQVNDEGYVVWVGDGNSWTEGVSKQLWGSQATLSNGTQYTWGFPIDYADAEGQNFQKTGSTVPNFNMGFSSNFRFKGFTFYGLIDAQSGGQLYSRTVDWGYGVEQRHGDNNQEGKTEETMKPTEYYRELSRSSGGSARDTFVFDAEYLKLRELSVRYSFGRKQLSGCLLYTSPSPRDPE